MSIVDLSRPTKDNPNTVRLNTGVRFCKIISHRYICPKCNIFCGELIPIIDGNTRKWMKKNKKDLSSSELQVQVFCFSGCHDHPAWQWKDFNWGSQKELDSVKSWPTEWFSPEAKKFEREARRAQELKKK